MAPMHVENATEVPEYEIDPKELDFTNSVNITKVTYHIYIPFGMSNVELYFFFLFQDSRIISFSNLP